MKLITKNINSHGFTLIETVGATAVFMVAVMAVISLFSESFAVFYSGSHHIRMQQDADWALEAMANKIRQGQQLTFPTINSQPALGVIEVSGTNIYSSYYYLNTNNQLIYINGAAGGKSYILLPNSKYYHLSNLAFSPMYSNRGVQIGLSLSLQSNTEVLSASYIAAVRNKK